MPNSINPSLELVEFAKKLVTGTDHIDIELLEEKASKFTETQLSIIKKLLENKEFLLARLQYRMLGELVFRTARDSPCPIINELSLRFPGEQFRVHLA